MLLTLLETNISHLKMEGSGLEDYIVSFWNGVFSGAFAVSFLGSVYL